MVNLEAVWDRTSEVFGERRADVLPIAVLLLFVPIAAMSLLMPLIGHEPSPRNIAAGCAAVAAGVVTVLGHLALTALVLNGGGWKAAVRAGAGRLIPAILISLIGIVAVVLAIAPIFVAFAMSGIVPRQTPGDPLPNMALGSAVFILAYSLVFAIVGLALLARLLLVNAALVGERRGVSALLRSLTLTRGMTLKLTGLVLLYIIVSQVAALATRTVFGTILGLLTLGGTSAPVVAVVTTILVALVQSGFSALATVFTARLFIAARDVRETIIELV